MVGLAVGLMTGLAAGAAAAHGGAHAAAGDGWPPWNWAPYVTLPLALCGWLYLRGTLRIWRASRRGSGIRIRQAAAFGAGWLTLAAALVSPLDALGGALFSAHMVQHELLMVVAAPLLAVSAPLVAFLWALPRAWRRRLGRLAHRGWWPAAWRALTGPLAVWAVYALVLWGWHVPGAFQSAVTSELVHALQHLSFFGAALLFWWVVVRSGRSAAGHGAAVIGVFTTAVHSTALGAFLTFAPTVWYPVYLERTAAWGLSPLEDQQLGGLIMWVPAGIVYVIAAVVLVARWLQASELRVQRRERQGWAGSR
jgi:putative membrane protein